jgi:hypothetical protein
MNWVPAQARRYITIVALTAVQQMYRGALWFKRKASGNETFSNTIGI